MPLCGRNFAELNTHLLKRFLFLLFALSFIGFLVFGVKRRKNSRISPQMRYWLAMVAFIVLLCFVLWRL